MSFFFYFFCSIRAWTQSFVLARQVLFYFNCAYSLVCFSCFTGRVLFFPGQTRPGSSYLYLLCSWNDSHMPPYPLWWLRWGLVKILPQLASNHSPPNICLLSNWNHRHELTCLAQFLFLRVVKYLSIYLSIYLYIYIYVCVCVCIYIYIEITILFVSVQVSIKCVSLLYKRSPEHYHLALKLCWLNKSPSPYPLSPRQSSCISGSMKLTTLNTPYKWNHSACLLWLASFS
jgi:hypothetical protein